MHSTRFRQSINLLHSLLFIKDSVGKHLLFSTLPITWATTIFATLIYYGIFKVKSWDEVIFFTIQCQGLCHMFPSIQLLHCSS
jgi:hypothetical protein